MIQREVRAVATILVLVMLVSMLITLRDNPAIYGAAGFLALLLVMLLLRRRRGSGSTRGAAGEFLCDSCKDNDQRYCHLPERPNALRCDAYRPR